MALRQTKTRETAAVHTHTVILLHGRGSNAEEFADDLLQDSKMADRLPNCNSLSDLEYEQDIQLPGLRASVKDIIEILQRELQLLDGRADRLILGGISQGEATALWTFLHLPGHFRTLEGFLAASGWLPFACHFRRVLKDADLAGCDARFLRAAQMAHNFSGLEAQLYVDLDAVTAFTTVPVFLGHGLDDAVIDAELGRDVYTILQKFCNLISWHEYEGAEQDGHWVKEPEETDDIVAFLQNIVAE